jgi:polyhydroxybutyrate depolymerase
MRWLLVLLAWLAACSPAPAATGDAVDSAIDDVAAADASDQGEAAVEAGPPSCDPGAKTGVDDGSVKTPAGTSVLVRTPTNYDPTIGAPLIIVYAACCISGAEMQAFTLLTPAATKDGYVIAYADHISPSSSAAFTDAASVLGAVTARYCVDTANVFLTGHSDGGSLDEVVAIEGLLTPRAIAPSASGLPQSQLAKCPAAAISVFEQHSSGDTLFPISGGYGAPVAAWWAKCGGCGAEDPPRPDGCIPYDACAGGVEVLYCQGTAIHGIWPNRDQAILAFFDAHRI